MSSTIPNIHALTKEIEERVRAARPSHLLYNPSDEWVEIMCNGSPIQIPPDGKGHDGTAAVRDVYGVDPEALRKARLQGIKRPDIPANKVILSALEAISHAIRKRHLRGIVFLTGDPEQDKVLKAQAREVWLDWRREQAERTIAVYRQQTAAFHADQRNTGQPAPPMPDHVATAQEFLDNFRLGVFQRKRLACPLNCGYYTDDQSRLDTHVRASHPLAPAAALPPPAPQPSQPPVLAPAAVTAEPETEPEPVGVEDQDEDPTGSNPRRPGRPRRATQNMP